MSKTRSHGTGAYAHIPVDTVREVVEYAATRAAAEAEWLGAVIIAALVEERDRLREEVAVLRDSGGRE